MLSSTKRNERESRQNMYGAPDANARTHAHSHSHMCAQNTQTYCTRYTIVIYLWMYQIPLTCWFAGPPLSLNSQQFNGSDDAMTSPFLLNVFVLLFPSALLFAYPITSSAYANKTFTITLLFIYIYCLVLHHYHCSMPRSCSSFWLSKWSLVFWSLSMYPMYNVSPIAFWRDSGTTDMTTVSSGTPSKLR